MNEINLKLVEKLLYLDYDVDEIEEFKIAFKKIEKHLGLNNKLLLEPNKISKFNKNRQNILDFISKYQDMIKVFDEKDLLWEMTGGFELNYHWDDVYRDIMLDFKTVKKEDVLKLLAFFRDNGFRNVEYCRNFDKKYYEKFNKKYDSDKYEIEYYTSDGKKTYLAQYYGDSFPVIFEDAKIILQYRANNWFSNGKTAYITTLDIDLEKVKYIEDEQEILKTVPFEEVKKFSKICSQIRAFDKQIEHIEQTIESTKKLLDFKELKELSSKQIKDLNILLKSTKEQRETIVTSYIELGYDKDVILRSLKHLKDAEWNASIHYD